MEVTNDMAMTFEGIMGEQLGLKFMKRKGYECFQPDMMCKDGRSDKWICLECKYKELWHTDKNDHVWWGTGLDVKQIASRMRFQQDTGIRTMLLTFDSKSDLRRFEQSRKDRIDRQVDCYWAWLDELEAAGDAETLKGKGNGKVVRIYNLELMNYGSLLYIPNKQMIECLQHIGKPL